MKKGIRIACLFFILLGIVGAFMGQDDSGTPSSTNPPENASTKVSQPKLEVLEHSVISDGYFKYVTGKIRNNTNKTYSYAQVSINLYNGESLLESTLDNINNLGPGQVWEFKAPVLNNDFTEYQIVEVTGF